MSFLKQLALFIDLYSFLWYNVYIKTDKNKRQQDSKITKNNTLMLYPYGKVGLFYPSGCCQADLLWLFGKITNGGIAMTDEKKDMHCYNSACYRLRSVCGMFSRMEKDRQGRLKKLTEGICAEGIVT